MTIVVTGAAGHVGSNLCVELLAEGHVVRAIDLREPARAVRHGAEWIRADVRDATAMRQALDRCEIVYHLAAVISVTGDLGGLVPSVNVDGVRVVAQTAWQCGVRRLVHCSSIHAFDLEAASGGAITESCPRAVHPRLPAYDRSKAEGERQVQAFVDRGLDAVVVNPTAIVGPADDGPSRMGAVLLALWRRRLPALTKGGFDWVDVRDVVSALRSAGERGRTGENYLVSGHRLSVTALASAAAAATGRRVTSRTVPDWTVRLAAPAGEVLHRRLGIPVVPTREVIHTLRSFPMVDSAKAAHDLAYRPRPIEETLCDLHAFFVSTGRLALVVSADKTNPQRSGGR